MTKNSISEYQETKPRKNRRRAQLLFEIWRQAPVSRGKLAKDLSLNLPTVSNLVMDLLGDERVTEQGYASSTGGRKAQLLDVNPDRGAVIGVTFSSRGISSAWADLQGVLQNPRIYHFSPADGKEKALERLNEAIEDQLAHHEQSAPHVPVVQIGLGVSGLLNSEAGISNAFPRFDEWVDVPLQQILEHRFKIPTVLDGHIAAIAQAEQLFGQHRGFSNALYVQLGPGLGLGIIINGRIYRGSRQNVGEFGHTTISEDGGPICYCGNYGCLESLASDYALIQQAEAAIREGVKTRIAEFSPEPGRITPGAVFRAAAEGDRFASNLVEKVGRLLGTGIANLVNLFGPELIILGGTMSEAGDLMLNPICHTLRQKALDRMEKDVQIRTSSFGKEEAIRGAVTLALHHCFSRGLAPATLVS